jgi:hypothetical protein
MQISQNDQIIAILQIAIYTNSQIIAIYKLYKFPTIGYVCKFINTAKLLQKKRPN